VLIKYGFTGVIHHVVFLGFPWCNIKYVEFFGKKTKCANIFTHLIISECILKILTKNVNRLTTL